MFGLIPRREKEKVGYPLPRLRDEFKTLYDRFFNGWPMLFEPLPVRQLSGLQRRIPCSLSYLELL